MGDQETRGFGDVLRRAREAKGRSVAEVAATTRLQIRYIEALEAESWGGVPGGVIGRGFVRVLAKELGGASPEWVDAYRVARGEDDAEPAHLMPETDWKVDLPGGQRRLNPVFVITLVVVGCALGVWVWSPWSVGGPPVEPVVPGPVVEPEAGAPPAPATAAPSASAVAETRVPAARTPAVAVAPVTPSVPPRTPVAEPVVETLPGARLGIRAVERTWIRVVADGGKARSRVLTPGEQVGYTADEGFEIKFGNAGGVRLTWNGEALKVPGKEGQVIVVALPADLATLRP